MNFDFGNVLTRAWQITWKHKVLWVLSALPMIVAFLFFPLFILPVYFLLDSSGQSEMFQSAEIILPILFFIGVLVLLVFNFLVNGISYLRLTASGENAPVFIEANA